MRRPPDDAHHALKQGSLLQRFTHAASQVQIQR